MKEKPYMVTGNHYLRDEDDISALFIMNFDTLKNKKSQPESQNASTELLLRGPLSSSSSALGEDPAVLCRDHAFICLIKQMFPSAENGSAWQLASPIKILRRVPFPQTGKCGPHHRAESFICLLSSFPAPPLSCQELSSCDESPWTRWVTHGHLFLTWFGG